MCLGKWTWRIGVMSLQVPSFTLAFLLYSRASSFWVHAAMSRTLQAQLNGGSGEDLLTSLPSLLTVPRKKHIKRLRILRVVSGLVVFTLLVLAIELPIYWNHIDNVTEFETLSQLIPFFLSIGVFFRSWALWIIRDRNQEEDWDDSWSTSVATSSIDPMEYWDRYHYGEYGYDYYDWPPIPQWPPSVYYSARSH